MATPIKAETMSLNGCIDYALKHNRQLNNLVDDITIMENRVREEKSAAYPSLNFQASILRYRTPGMLNSKDFAAFLPVGYNPSTENTYDWEIQLSQVLYSFGKIPTALDLANLGKQWKEVAVRTSRLELRMNIEKVFRTILFVREQKKIYQTVLQNRGVIRDQVKIKLEVGDAVKLDLLRMESLISEIPPILAGLDASDRQLRHTLKLLLGMDPDADLAIHGAMLDTIVPVNDRVADLQDQALARRSEIEELSILTGMKRKEQLLTKAQLNPSLNFTGSYGITAVETKNMFDHDYQDWNAMVMFSKPFYDGGRVEAKTRQQDFEIKQMQRSLEDLKHNILNAVFNTVDSLNTQVVKKSSLDVYLRTTEEAMRVSLELFNEGFGTISDYKLTEEEYLKATMAILSLRHEYSLLRADLDRILASPLGE